MWLRLAFAVFHFVVIAVDAGVDAGFGLIIVDDR